MRTLLPVLALCTACSPASETTTNGRPQPVRTLATQTEAPSPNYSALLGEETAVGGEGRLREATSPLPSNAKAVGDFWIAQLKSRRALLGYGLADKGANGPVNMIDTGLTEPEFNDWTNANGWRVPGHIRWSFVPTMSLPRVSEAAKGAIRTWPASHTRTGIQPQALIQGKVELRDGCFYVGSAGQPVDKLAWFHSEVGLDIDSSGYFILRDRVSGQTLSRLGEQMNWSGPASASIDKREEQALQDACGPGEIYIVGSPQARERFLSQYPHLRGPPRSPPPAPLKK